MDISGFYQELRRRKVIRVTFVYVVVAWLIVQIAETTFEPLQLPDWSLPFVIIILALGLPIAMVLAWAFDLTPDGLVRDSELAKTNSFKTNSPLSDAPSIGVLPFEDMSEEKNQGYFCDGIADEILNLLTKIESLQVASRTSSFQYKNKFADIKEIGRQLNVKNILEGSVRKQGSQILITAQLINVNNGYHLWSERYHRDLADIFLIQEEIANCIVTALEVSLSSQEQRVIKMRSTKNIDAYEYYLRGWHFFHRTTQKDLLHAIEMFKKAIDKDADFSRAWAGIADTYAFLYLYFDNQPYYREKASSCSKQALKICSEQAESHVSRGMAHLLCHEFKEAETELNRAIELAPRSFEAFYFYGRSYFHQGKLAEAAAMFEKASSINPDDYQSVLLLPQIYRSLGRVDDALNAGKKGVEVARNFLQLNPDDSRALCLGAIQLVYQGDIEEGKHWIERAIAINDCDSIILYNATCLYVRIGELDIALDHLENVVLTGMVNREWLEHDSDLDPLRNDARFISLLQKLEETT
jgi:adenylate cyclase